MSRRIGFGISAAALGALALSAQLCAAQGFNVTTYHYDNWRTGWNAQETTLTAANVAGGTFGTLATFSLGTLAKVAVNAQAQPLIVTGLNIPNQGVHDVLYIATEGNSVYMLDANTGALLNSRSFGPPIPAFAEPSINTPVGIEATPVIDLTRGAMYLINTYAPPGGISLQIHKVSLTTLQDMVAPVTISGSHMLVNGSTISFTASAQRQRPGLLESNNVIYAGFGSYGDMHENTSRGWLLGWNADTLTPLPANTVTNTLATSIGNCVFGSTGGPCFLSSIWMSGYAPAADASGNVYVLTGNSDPGTYDGVNNFQESALKVSGDLTTIIDYFTPWQVKTMDQNDFDLSAGGIMALPDQPGSIPHLAVGEGKPGELYLLNRDGMGGHTTAAPDNVLGEYGAGPCWCGPSYYVNSNGTPMVVASGGNYITLFQVSTSPTPSLVRGSHTIPLSTGQDPGFFTSVSSNGTTAGTAIIWALARPQTTQGAITLYAFNGLNGALVYQGAIGTWTIAGGDADLVPVVANGKVYVVAGNNVVIMGLGGTAVPTVASEVEGSTPDTELRYSGNEIFGFPLSVQGDIIKLQTRTGKIVTVDGSKAAAADTFVNVVLGRALGVEGTYDPGDNAFDASVVFYAKDSPMLWPADK